MVRGLIGGHHAEDARLPLLVWWAIEAKVSTNPSEVVNLFREESLWRAPIVEHDITSESCDASPPRAAAMIFPFVQSY